MTVKLSNLPELTNALTTDWIAVSTDVGAGVLVTMKVRQANLFDDGQIPGAKLEDDAITTVKIGDLAVTIDKIGNDAVDDTKAGNRVPQFYRRQGGSDTDWSVAGTTTRTPGAVRMQAGVATITILAANFYGLVTVTFPQAFSNKPIVMVTPKIKALPESIQAMSSGYIAESTTQVGIGIMRYDTYGTNVDYEVAWLAIGPE